MPSDKVLEPAAAGARRFAGKIAIVAGAGQGIGRATARRLGQEGAAVMVADIVAASAEKVAGELREHGVQARAFVGDLTEVEPCQELMKRTKESFGRIDVLVNIVGGTIWAQSYQYYTPEQIIAEVKKSFWSPMWLCWSVLPYMIEQRSGAIVNLSTCAIVSRFRVPYAAAKGGVIGLTASLAKEMVRYGIRVNAVAPHGTAAEDRVTPRNYGINIPATELPPEEKAERDKFFGGPALWDKQADQIRLEIPMARYARPEEQAAAIAFLASDDASFITGETVAVGGGATFPF
jgi:dihydroxycyclohexadiene carboxylate dehydrogenase